jgi:hypothetical protein
MLKFFKLWVLLLLLVAGAAVAATTTVTSYLTKSVTLADGSVIKQRYQLTYVNKRLTARELISTTVVSGPTSVPVISYDNQTTKVTRTDGSMIQEVYRLTYTDGKLTARALVTTTVLSVPPVVAVVPVVVPPPVVAVVPLPVVAVTDPVISLNYVTVTVTLANGSVVKQRYQLTYTDKKLTARELISTTLVSGPPLAVVAPVAAPTTPIIANYTPSTYYNNANIGTPSSVPSNNPAYYLTPEANRTISAVGANYAYARGWTGQGSTILVMDTGINLTSPEFAGKIKYSVDYTKTGIQDTYGHGSQTASVAAAAMDGTGMYGVAFGADLAIAKIGSSSGVSMMSAQAALKWAQQYSDIVVANLSANATYSSGYIASVYKQPDGTYYSNDVNYGSTNYYSGKPTDWSNVLGKEMVLVVAAGNQSIAYVQSPASFANATDANGNLVLNGQMLIAGGWNTTNNSMFGAGAGTVCKVTANGVCQDKYRTSDFFLLAPAVSIKSINADGSTTLSSGTSFAAPAIAGAAAIVHQLWPYMQGNQIVQLLLKTGNKNLPGYDVNVMGQGLLDLNKATQPVGDLGISVTGRTGAAVPLSGSFSVAGGTDAAVSSAASNVSAVDSLQRDFTVNLLSTTNAMIDPVAYMNHTAGNSWSGRFAGVGNTVGGVSAVGFGNNFSFSLSSAAFSKEYQPLQYQATVTKLGVNPWINFSGVWGQSRNSNTVEVSALYSPAPEGTWGQAGMLNTTGEYSYGMVTNVSTIRSVYAMAGWRNKNVNLYAGIKPTIVSGSASLTVPTSVNAAGDMQYSNITSRIRNTHTGFVGASYEYVPYRDHSVNFLATVGQDKTGQLAVRYSLAL